MGKKRRKKTNLGYIQAVGMREEMRQQQRPNKTMSAVILKILSKMKGGDDK